MIAGVREGEGEDLPRSATLVSRTRSSRWHPTDSCCDHMCQSRLLFSTRNSSPNAGMQLICCGAGGTFFSLLLFLLLPLLLLLQPSFLSPGSAAGGGNDATCQADSFLSIWAKVVISWRCGGEGWVGRKKWLRGWGM